MYKQTVLAAALGGLVLLAACGGGGGSSDSGSTPSGGTDLSGKTVAGPLDPVQTQLGSGVFDPLASSVTGTPLESVVACGEAIVNQDVLDIADTVLVALQTAAANPGASDPQALAGSLSALLIDLGGLIQAMAGHTTSCTTQTLSLSQLQNLLAALEGTPLEPLSTQLSPVIAQIAAALAASGGGTGSGQDMQLATLAALVSQLSDAMQAAMAQIPADAYAAPIVGTTLTTVATALTDLDALFSAVLSYHGAATGSALQTLIDHLLVNITTRIVPLQELEEQAGQSGAISGPIADAVAQLSAVIGASVGQVLTPTFDTLLGQALAPVLNPIENQVLPAIVGPLLDALAVNAGGTDGPLQGTPLAPAVNVVNQVLGGLVGILGGGTGGTGGGSGGGSGGAGTCAFANIPLLSILCGGN